MDVWVLVNPGANRVYGAQSAKLAASELRAVGAWACEGAIIDVEPAVEAGIRGLRVTVDDSAWGTPTTKSAVMRAFSYSPHVFAAMEEVGRMPVLDSVDNVGGTEPSAGHGDPRPSAADLTRHYVDELETLPLWQPLAVPSPEVFGSELVTTLKYQGKTNEQLTAMMLHLAAAASGHSEKLALGTLRVLDPVAGRGSTLNQALAWGLSPVGVDIDKKDAELYRGFLSTWMRESRFKHSISNQKLTIHGTNLGSHVHAELSRTKQEQKAGKTFQVDLYTADTTHIGRFLKKRSVEVVVGDLPYGVQHGSRSGGGLKRSPLELLESALPAWRDVMVTGGAMALAINRHTTPWERTAAALDSVGLTVASTDGQFRHRVDASIDRDIIIATR